MKNLFNSPIVKIGLANVVLLFLAAVSFAQAPTHIPREKPEPVNFFESTEHIVFFVVIPLVVVVLYFLWRRQVRKEAEKKRNEQ